MINDIEYMQQIPPGYVTRQIQPKVNNITVGQALKFGPADYAGIPIRHFLNTLMSVLGSQYGYHNMRTVLDQQSGVIQAIRLG